MNAIMTPVHPCQRVAVKQLLQNAENTLEQVREGRWNLDPETRRAVCEAMDCIGAAYTAIREQPLIEGGAA